MITAVSYATNVGHPEPCSFQLIRWHISLRVTREVGLKIEPRLPGLTSKNTTTKACNDNYTQHYEHPWQQEHL